MKNETQPRIILGIPGIVTGAIEPNDAARLLQTLTADAGVTREPCSSDFLGL